MKAKIKFLLFGFIVLIWFSASFIGLSYTANMNEGSWTIAIVGQFFFVLGILVFAISKEKIAIPFILVGFIIILGAGINLYGSEDIINLFNEKGISILLGSAFIFFGTGFWTPLYRKRKRRRHTEIVEATCKTFKRKAMDIKHYQYSPIWSYSYGVGEYTCCNDFYSPMGNPKIGEHCKIYLNPNDPTDVYVPINFANRCICILMGALWIGIGIIAIYSILK